MAEANYFEEPAMGLYIHIPFCVRKCDYCDFLSFPAGEEYKRKYLTAMLREIEWYGNRMPDREISTVYIGGGTPSAVNGSWIQKIMDTVFTVFRVRSDAEISIECNPGTIDIRKLDLYHAGGINRLSFGLQSADDEELKNLGRIHNFRQFLDSFDMARNEGFDNINVDLMSGLPHQTVRKFEDTLNRVIALAPEHISMYSLMIEKNTPFYERYHEDSVRQKNGEETTDLPDEETEIRIAAAGRKLLKEAGYERYEISNYAKFDRQCRHNTGYWTGVDYLGVGLGASSYLNGIRFKNTTDLKEYTEKSLLFKKNPAPDQSVSEADDGIGSVLHREGRVLSRKDKREEFMFLGLRMTEGVSISEYQYRFGLDLLQTFKKEITDLRFAGLMNSEGDRLFLTEKGLDLSNYCMEKFMES